MLHEINEREFPKFVLILVTVISVHVNFWAIT